MMDSLKESDSLSAYSMLDSVKEELFNPTVCTSNNNLGFGLTRMATLKGITT